MPITLVLISRTHLALRTSFLNWQGWHRHLGSQLGGGVQAHCSGYANRHPDSGQRAQLHCSSLHPAPSSSSACALCTYVLRFHSKRRLVRASSRRAQSKGRQRTRAWMLRRRATVTRGQTAGVSLSFTGSRLFAHCSRLAPPQAEARQKDDKSGPPAPPLHHLTKLGQGRANSRRFRG